MSESNEYQHILVAVDQSADAEKVGRQALIVAQRNHAKITLLNILEGISISAGYELMPIIPQVSDSEIIAEAKKSMRELSLKLGIPDCDTMVISALSTKEGILRAAEELKADLLVIGSHTRSGLGVLLGSTSGSIINDSPCDILTVKVS
ncbi:universal stress protein [Ignatzschineria cameli]|uniref:Universal stress protein n=1 Tax=Ignatzschineria cameli TaxID=2182793 RepID=A0A2U2ARS3_9GAMM|nr:universal stress protein [Ignatzschineria cameli]PWD86867.1 universal stress protein [Ignatzschineria cameli]PWD91841.1 universal stress protein [Ignatzschineria cameli]PWD93573.1 universal stress protein [Ignatzschineria cameli]PWD94315.1 universal stress protein [Ignatzschineria cameli]